MAGNADDTIQPSVLHTVCIVDTLSLCNWEAESWETLALPEGFALCVLIADYQY